jgi:chromate transporter
MLDIIALAQSIPGAMAINTSMLVGYKLRGIMGALVSLIGAFLPPLLVISVVYVFYELFQTNLLIQSILLGMRGAVSAVMILFCL